MPTLHLSSIPYLEPFLFGAAFLLLLGVLSSTASSRMSVPILAFFIVVGMLAGSEGIGGIAFNDFRLTYSLGTIALIFILFAGGMESKWSIVRPVLAPGILLATVGVVVTSVLMGLSATLIFGLTPLQGQLLGAIVASTDAAAVFAVLKAKSLRLRGRILPMLELESGSNDPMAVFLTFVITQICLTPNLSLLSFAPHLVLQIVIGVLVGYLVGRGAVRVINQVVLDYEGLYPVVTIGTAILSYSATQMLGGSGFLAVYVTGLIMGSRSFLHKVTLLQFHDGLAWLMQVTMFVVLGLLVFPSKLMDVAIPGLVLSIILIFVARPLAVLCALLPIASLTIRKKLFIGWVGLRGAVPIVLATIPMNAGVEGADLIFNIVFFIVLASLLIHGTTIRFAAKFFDVLIAGKLPLVERRVASNMFEVVLEQSSLMLNKRVVDIGIPTTALIVLLTRGRDTFIPRGSTVLEAGDKLLIASRKNDVSDLQELFKH